MIPIIQILVICGGLAVLLALAADEARAAVPQAASLTLLPVNVHVDVRELKTLQAMDSAHGQLEEWSQRLLSRLENGMGPRMQDPILSGRADLQVHRIAPDQPLYAQDPALAFLLRDLADAHSARLVALQRMTRDGVDRDLYVRLDAPVQRLVAQLERRDRA